jgi:hypothetical protein
MTRMKMKLFMLASRSRKVSTKKSGGVSSSPDFPVTDHAIQPTHGGGDIDGLLVKVAFGHSH